jgi:hypothetical protein
MAELYVAQHAHRSVAKAAYPERVWKLYWHGK